MDIKIKWIKRLSMVLWVTVLTAAIIGVFSIRGTPREILSIHGETLLLHNHGIYRYDTVSVAIQAISQDFVTIFVFGSLFVFALIKLKKDNELSKLFLIGLLGYSLYSYMSYTFLSHFNALFLVYVFNMSLSLYILIQTILLLNMDVIQGFFKKSLPIKQTVIFMVLVSVMITLMWLGRILPSYFNDTLPIGLESYHTLTIQAMDLGFIVPLSLLSAYHLSKKQALGYALSAVLLFKGTALFTAVSAMAIVKSFIDQQVNYVEVLIFLSLSIIAGFITFHFFTSSIKQEK